MEPLSERDVSLATVALLLERQNYDEALEILGDLMKENPSDRETKMYRLLVLRILVLRHGLNRANTRSASYPGAIADVFKRAASTVGLLDFGKSSAGSADPTDKDPSPGLQTESAESRQEADAPAKNKELLERITHLSAELAAQQKTIERLEQTQDEERASNHQLRAANEDLEKETLKLKQQLQKSETRINELLRENASSADRGLSLQNELTALKQQCDAIQGELQARDENLSRVESENQRVRAENQQLQHDVTSLQTRIHESETMLSTYVSQYEQLANRNSELQNEATELDRKLLEVQARNEELLDELNAVSSRLAEKQRAFENLERALHEAQSDNQRLHGTNESLDRELAHMKQKLQISESRLIDTASENRKLAERSSKLQSQVADVFALKQQLNASKKALAELQHEHERLEELESENRRLQVEIGELQTQLQWSQNRLSESGYENQDLTRRNAQLQSELADLTEQFEEAQPTAGDLEALTHHLEYIRSSEMTLSERQQSLEMQIAELQRELSARNEPEPLAPAYRRLSEIEHLYREIKEENRRLYAELSAWQDRFAAGRNMSEASSVRMWIDEPPAKTSTVTFQLEEPRWRTISSIQGDTAHGTAIQPARQSQAAVVENLEESSERWLHRYWPALVPTIGALTMAALIPIAFVDRRSGESSGSKQAVVSSIPVTSENTTTINTPETPVKTLNPEASATAERYEPKTVPASRTPRTRSMFKIIRPAQVYSAPTEISGQIAHLSTGTKVTVVGSRDGWLEIRSHGRPPGFIHQNAAVRVNETEARNVPARYTSVNFQSHFDDRIGAE